MTTTMNDSHTVSISQIKSFLKGSASIQFQGTTRQEKYQWLSDTLTKFRYLSLTKKDKSTVKKYLMKLTGYSDAQLTRLIAQKRKVGVIQASSRCKHRFPTKYTPSDIACLAETDKAHGKLSGPATKRIFERQHEVYGKGKYVNIKEISVSHLYNLRETRQYRSHTKFFSKTKPSSVPIGKRVKPEPQGQPGFLRVDTVHQGDLDKAKGVYHINIVDEVLQWELVGSVEGISERFLQPLLEDILEQFPIKIINFHSDNGSEFINYQVAALLEKLRIEQTKSRARRVNDNALVESKNGAVIRKHMGYAHIPTKHAREINEFYKEYLNPYLNFHRPCGFATLKPDRRGKLRKVYDTYLTPYEKLKTIDNIRQYLKPGITLEDLESLAKQKSDNEAAAEMQKAKYELFKHFRK